MKMIKNRFFGACSSVVERYVDIVEVISSILIMPTKTHKLHRNLIGLLSIKKIL